MTRFNASIAVLFASFALPAAQPGSADSVRVFPGARGFGVRTQAGRGGRIIRVTNLNTEGAGSLREAVLARGPRLVVFEVGGVIDLQAKPLAVTEPFLTLAGQTSPSPGITLVRGGFAIRTHDVLLHHLRVRPGDGGLKKAGGSDLGVTLSGPEAYNIVIDHCSITWGVAANLSIGGPLTDSESGTARYVTVSNSLIAEALQESTVKGAPSMGASVADGCTNIAFIANLFAHNDQGNPSFRAGTTGVVVNNIIYNPGRSAIQLDWRAADWAGRKLPPNPRISVAGNVMFAGPDSADGLALISRKGDTFSPTISPTTIPARLPRSPPG